MTTGSPASSSGSSEDCPRACSSIGGQTDVAINAYRGSGRLSLASSSLRSFAYTPGNRHSPAPPSLTRGTAVPAGPTARVAITLRRLGAGGHIGLIWRRSPALDCSSSRSSPDSFT
jgi:hypothetical protein